MRLFWVICLGFTPGLTEHGDVSAGFDEAGR